MYEKYVSNIKSYLNNENYDDYLLNLVERALGVEDQSDFRANFVKKIDAGYDWRSDRNMMYAIQQIAAGN